MSPDSPPTPAQAQRSLLATLALIVAIASWFVAPLWGGIVAVILALAARSEIKKTPTLQGAPMAKWALIIGYVHIVVYSLIVLDVVFSMFIKL